MDLVINKKNNYIDSQKIDKYESINDKTKIYTIL